VLSNSRKVWLAASLIAVVELGSFVVLPLVGWPAVTRVSVLLIAGALIAGILARPWRWTRAEAASTSEWSPSPRIVWTSAAVATAVLFWFVPTRFRSGDINAVDFTVYYDRPLFQTLHGRPLLVETADDLRRAYQTYFSVHAHWAMVPLAALYAIYPTPLWLLALSVVAVVLGAVNVLRVVERMGAGGLVASASALGSC
jgi:hypothetical protein